MDAGSAYRRLDSRAEDHRGLSTARAALRVATLLAGEAEGLRADDVAQALGKSLSTAYNLLASFEAEGVAVHVHGGTYRLAPAFRRLVAAPATRPADLAPLVDELLARTHRRSYLAVVREGGLRVTVERGLQGMPKVPGMRDEIARNAHATGLGKVVLALAAPDGLDRYVCKGLRRYTAHTITDPKELRAELAEVRRTGIAVDRAEFDEHFCSIAAPVLDGRRRFLGAIGISLSPAAFADDRRVLEDAVRAVTGRLDERRARTAFQPCDETRFVLAGAERRSLPSAAGGQLR